MSSRAARQHPPNRLRVLRAERRWNQRTVAAKLGCGLDRYWKIENGVTDPEQDERRKLAQIFQRSIADVFPAPAQASA